MVIWQWRRRCGWWCRYLSWWTGLSSSLRTWTFSLKWWRTRCVRRRHWLHRRTRSMRSCRKSPMRPGQCHCRWWCCFALSLSLSPCVCICLCVFWYLSMFVYFRQSCIHVYAVVPLLVPLMFNTVACYMLWPVSVSMFSACLLQVGVVLKRHNFRSCKQHHSSSGTLVFWCQSANWNSLFSVACSSFSRLV